MKNNLDPQVAAGDKKLAHSAQMFHYQHQKNQLIAMENRNGAAAELSHVDDQDNDSDENENDFTVYGMYDINFSVDLNLPKFFFSFSPRMPWIGRFFAQHEYGGEKSTIFRGNTSSHNESGKDTIDK